MAFITCAEAAQDFATNHDRRALLQAVRNALQAGANIINISFSRATSRDLVDPGTILPELQSEFAATWISSVGQPAYSFRRVGSVMSFFSASCGTLLSEKVLDPEGGLPALMLTFSAPEGLLCTIITSVPKLPKRTRARMLNSYADAAAETKAGMSRTNFLRSCFPYMSNIHESGYMRRSALMRNPNNFCSKIPKYFANKIRCVFAMSCQ